MLSQVLAGVPVAFRAQALAQLVADATNRLLTEMVGSAVKDPLRCALHEWLTPICEWYFVHGGEGKTVPVIVVQDYRQRCRADKRMVDWAVVNHHCHSIARIYKVEQAMPSCIFRFLPEAQNCLSCFALEVAAGERPIMSVAEAVA